jgi:hypothetical protein
MFLNEQGYWAGEGAVVGLEVWLEEVVVERERRISEELVKCSCVGSAEWFGC